MPAGDYYLNKFNGSSIDEKIFVAQFGKALSFDVSLNPVMLDVSLASHTHAYLPLSGGTMSNTTVVTNLNADLLDGQHGSYYSPTTHTHSYLPLTGGTMSNTTVVTNLNADLLDGQHGSYYSPSTHTHPTYIPYTGGTSNVNLGVHNLTVDTTSLFVDSVNHRVGMGTISPGAPLHVFTTGVLSGNTVMFQNNNIAGRVIQYCGMTYDAGGASFDMRAHGSSYVETLFGVSMADATALLGIQNSRFVIGNYQYSDLILGTNNKERIKIMADGRISIGQIYTSWEDDISTTFNPTAMVHLQPGTGDEGTAPLKLTSGPILAIPEPGAFEYNGTALYFTTASGRVPLTASSLDLQTVTDNGWYTTNGILSYNFMQVANEAGIIFKYSSLYAGAIQALWNDDANGNMAAVTLGANITGLNIMEAYLNLGTNDVSVRMLTASLNQTTFVTEIKVGDIYGDASSRLSFLSDTLVMMYIDASATDQILLLGTTSINSVFKSTVTTGTSPFTLASTTLVTNLNADLLDGNHASAFASASHTHSNYDNYNQWTFQPENFAGSGASYTINSGYFVKLKAGTGMDLTHSLTGSTVTVTLTSSGGFPGFGTTHTTCAYGDHTHSNYDNYNQWILMAYNGAYDSYAVTAGSTLTLDAGPNIAFDTADLGGQGILVISVVNIPDIVLTGYTYGSTGLISASDSLKVALSKLQTQMPKTLYWDVSDAINVGTGVQDNNSYTLPANTLSADGQRLELLYSGSSAANTNAKTIQFYFGGTSYITLTNSSSTSLNWFLKITLIRYSSTYFRLRFDGNWNVVGSGTAIGSGITYSSTNTIKLTVQGGATSDITCKQVTITHFSS